ncbi:NAD(P)H-binding protein [Kribbella sp. CA-247076]|uniref:NAD(P)H-binding protein n=1 Tax=Kribbella sp. CA-247076 TaxID=3239941 RepID=UPI003D8B7A71
MKVLLAGASGTIGPPLVRQLQTAGHHMVAIHRSPRGGDVLRAAQATAIQVDVLDRNAHDRDGQPAGRR